jgi:uncharacterized membrane protein
LPGLTVGLASLLTLYVKRAVFYEEPVADLAMTGIPTAIWLVMTLLFYHLVITKVGMIYIDAEVLREGNDQTLDNLEEGVIILDERDLQIQF